MSIRDLINELEHIDELLEDDNSIEALEELQNQSGTIDTLITYYKSKEYKTAKRRKYLETLADDHGVEFTTVLEMAYLLGENEDHDGLVSAVQDMGDL